MSKELFFSVEARNKLKSGVDKLANAVSVTLGPKGRNVIIERQHTTPHITKDGVTVANSINLKDPTENMGAQMVKEVAGKTADDAGDGTTTATILAQVMITEGLKNVAAGANPMDLKKGIDKATAKVVEYIKSISVRVDDNNEKIKQIGIISANGDKEIGTLIAEAMDKVGNDGIITVEESANTQTSIKVVEGMQFDRGYISTYFINTQNGNKAIYNKPYILVTDKKITAFAPLKTILESIIAEAGSSLLIISEDMDGEALGTLALNVVKNGLPVVAVKAPAFGQMRKEMLMDICALTNAVFITEEQGEKLENVTIAKLGKCESIVVTYDNTTIIGGYGKKERILKRIESINTSLEDAMADQDKDRLKQRRAQLTGGVAILYVGASTELEMKEKKDRIDDALHATRAAIEEGIVPGGGVAYIRAIESLKDIPTDNNDEITGISIVRRALEEPLRKIVANAGIDPSDIMHKVKAGTGDYGYNAREDRFAPLLEEGVIDPAKVSRVALENAASIASMLLTTECIIIEEEEKVGNQ